MGIKILNPSPPRPMVRGQNIAPSPPHHLCGAGRGGVGWGKIAIPIPNVLWAYRTTAESPTGETPFKLIYGTKAMIPVEVGITSIKQEMFHEESNDDQLKVNLDYLDEVRDEASNRMSKYRQKMA